MVAAVSLPQSTAEIGRIYWPTTTRINPPPPQSLPIPVDAQSIFIIRAEGGSLRSQLDRQLTELGGGGGEGAPSIAAEGDTLSCRTAQTLAQTLAQMLCQRAPLSQLLEFSVLHFAKWPRLCQQQLSFRLATWLTMPAQVVKWPQR